MKINDAIREIMKTQRVTQRRLVETINANGGNIKSQSVIAERLKRSDTMQMDKALEMLDALGYELVVQPRSTRGKRASGAYVIDNKVGDDE